MNVTDKHLPISNLEIGAYFLVLLIAAITATTHWEDSSYFKVTIVTICIGVIARIFFVFRRTFIGYRVYIGLTGKTPTVELYDPLKPPPCDHGIAVNLATGKCTWVVGNANIDSLLASTCTIKLESGLKDFPPDSSAYWFTQPSEYSPPWFTITQGDEVARVNLHNLISMVQEKLLITIPYVHLANLAIKTREQAELEVLRILAEYSQFSSSSRFRDASVSELELLERVYKLRQTLSLAWDRSGYESDTAALKQRLEQLRKS